jgi:aromatic ring-opening dioxygenase catalytic subunit (LigB family)
MWAQVKLGTFFLCPQTGFCIFDSQQTITIFKELGVQIPAFTPSNGIVCRGDFYLAFQ